MLVNVVTLLQVARENQFAVPAFNISDYAMMKGIFEVSEETNSPLIIAIHPDEQKHVGDSFLRSATDLALRSSVPVVRGPMGESRWAVCGYRRPGREARCTRLPDGGS